MRFVKEDPWWESHVDMTTSEEIAVETAGCITDVGCFWFVLFLPFFLVYLVALRVWRWFAELFAR